MTFLWLRQRPMAAAWALARTRTPGRGPSLLRPGRVARPPALPWLRLEAAMSTTSAAATETTPTATPSAPVPMPPTPDEASVPPSDATPHPLRKKSFPGKIARVLDLVDEQRKPPVTYSPQDELFTLHPDTPDGTIMHRMAVNKNPKALWRIKVYNKFREIMFNKRNVFHRRWRGSIAAITQQFFSLHKAPNDFSSFLGPKAEIWNPDLGRKIHYLRSDRTAIFKPMSTTATIEYLESGKSALLWLNMVPERYDGSDGGGFPSVKSVDFYTWANKNQPWKELLYHLRRSPSHQLKAPSVSPFSSLYEIYPDGRKPPPPPPPPTTTNAPPPPRPVVEYCYFLHFMPLFMKTFGRDGLKAKSLWGEGKRNDNLPVVMAWQDQYVWFIWRNGPDGPLELQQTGWWIPKVAEDQPNYDAEKQMMSELPPPLYGSDQAHWMGEKFYSSETLKERKAADAEAARQKAAAKATTSASKKAAKIAAMEILAETDPEVARRLNEIREKEARKAASKAAREAAREEAAKERDAAKIQRKAARRAAFLSAQEAAAETNPEEAHRLAESRQYDALMTEREAARLDDPELAAKLDAGKRKYVTASQKQRREEEKEQKREMKLKQEYERQRIATQLTESDPEFAAKFGIGQRPTATKTGRRKPTKASF